MAIKKTNVKESHHDSLEDHESVVFVRKTLQDHGESGY